MLYYIIIFIYRIFNYFQYKLYYIKITNILSFIPKIVENFKIIFIYNTNLKNYFYCKIKCKNVKVLKKTITSVHILLIR